MAIIKFEDYVVDKSVYETNLDFENSREDGRLVVPIKFSAEIGVDKTQEIMAIKSAIGTFASKSTASENPTSGTVTSASRLKSIAKTSSATYQKAKQDKQANVSNTEKNKAKNTSDKVEIDDNPDSTFG